MFRNTSIAIILFLSFSACNELYTKKEETKWIQKSPALDSVNVQFSSIISDYSVLFRFELDFTKKYTFRITPANDTLSISNFMFEIENKGNTIPLDTIFFQQNCIPYLADSIKMMFLTPKMQLKDTKILLDFDIPKIAFHYLPRGKNTITLHLFQDSLYYQQQRGQIMTYQELKGEALRIFEGRVSFELDMPSVFRRLIQLDSIELIETTNADFTLINRGYADVFWQLRDNKNQTYFESKVVNQTKTYKLADVFNYYYLFEHQKIGIYVWDWDALSKNDYQGHWDGLLESFDSTQNYRILQFHNIKHLSIRISEETKIN